MSFPMLLGSMSVKDADFQNSVIRPLCSNCQNSYKKRIAYLISLFVATFVEYHEYIHVIYSLLLFLYL